MLNSISSNQTNLAFAEEKALKLLPSSTAVPTPDAADPTWYGLEPNSYPEFGATFTTLARTPITNTRQRAKGTVTDKEAKGGFNTDLTQRNLLRLMQGFFFIDAKEKPTTNPVRSYQVADPTTGVADFNVDPIVITSVDTTAGNHINAAAGFTATPAGFLVGHLVVLKGFGLNSGLKKLTAVASGILTTTDALTAEATPPAAAYVEAVGYEFPATDLALTVPGDGTVVLTSAAKNPTTFGLNVGEWIFVGGDAAGTKFATAGTFFGRIKSINATQIILDETSRTPAADVGTGKTIRIFFGKFVRNATQYSEIVRRTYQLERQLGSDDVGTQAEYLVGACPNEMVINMPETNKVTADLNFVCCDAEYKTGTDGLKTGTRVAALGEDAINTSSDVVMARLAIVDETLNPTALFAYATEFKLTINNGITPNKAVGVLGAFEVNAADFVVTGTAACYFASVAAAAGIKNNSDVNMTLITAKKNAGLVFDIPLLTLGGGLNKVEKDKPIMVDLTQDAAKNAAGYTAGFTFFEYLPTVAMPA